MIESEFHRRSAMGSCLQTCRESVRAPLISETQSYHEQLGISHGFARHAEYLSRTLVAHPVEAAFFAADASSDIALVGRLFGWRLDCLVVWKFGNLVRDALNRVTPAVNVVNE